MAYHLEVSYDFDFKLLGISCHEKDYRLCWLLNKSLDLEFKREEDLSLQFDHGECHFPVFIHDNEDDLRFCTLLKNRSHGTNLLPELPQIDYLLKLDNLEEDISDLKQRIRTLPQVAAIFELDVEKLDSKDHLILD